LNLILLYLSYMFASSRWPPRISKEASNQTNELIMYMAQLKSKSVAHTT